MIPRAALQIYAVAVIASVAALDLVTGVYLLTSSTPWMAHGPETVWTDAAPLLADQPALAAALRSLWQRVGAFSVFAGLMTMVWLWRGLRDPTVLRTLLVAYLVAGLAFGLTDARWFAGTDYHLFKQAVGGLWVTALAAHALANRAAPAAPDVRQAR